MTQYAKITDFASKDALLTGNPAKIVKGVEIDDEFNAIATADATSVKGPITATVDNTVARWDGITGRTVQASGVTISDADVVTASGFIGPLSGAVSATTLSASSTVSGAGFVSRFSAPGAIGDVTPSTGAFTTLSATGIATIGTTDATAVIKAGGANTDLTLGACGANGSIYFNAGGVANDGTIGVNRAVLDYFGNLGLGVTPSTLSGITAKALEIGTVGNIVLGGNTFHSLTQNAYYDTGYKYGNTAAASYYGQSAGAHSWFTAPSGTAGNAITFTQSLAVGKGTTLALEGATSAAGTGIAFPATQLASSNANTLDDYEEGTFTPTIVGTSTAGAGTYSVQFGSYTKIGDTVYFQLTVIWTAHTGTGNMRVGGLPFTVANVANQNSIMSVAASNLTFSGQLTAETLNNNTVIVLETFTTGGAITALTLDTAANIYITGHYKV